VELVKGLLKVSDLTASNLLKKRITIESAQSCSVGRLEPGWAKRQTARTRYFLPRKSNIRYSVAVST